MRLGDAPHCGRCRAQLLPGQSFELNQGNFAKQIKGDLPLLVDVWAAWCGPCQSFSATFAQAATELQGRCRMGKLNSEDNPQLATELAVRSIPCLILFRNGVEIARQSGALPLQQLHAWLHIWDL